MWHWLNLLISFIKICMTVVVLVITPLYFASRWIHKRCRAAAKDSQKTALRNAALSWVCVGYTRQRDNQATEGKVC